MLLNQIEDIRAARLPLLQAERAKAPRWQSAALLFENLCWLVTFLPCTRFNQRVVWIRA